MNKYITGEKTFCLHWSLANFILEAQKEKEDFGVLAAKKPIMSPTVRCNRLLGEPNVLLGPLMKAERPARIPLTFPGKIMYLTLSSGHLTHGRYSLEIISP